MTPARGQHAGNHDYVAAIDTPGSGAALPSTARISSGAPSLDGAYSATAA